MYPKNAAKPIAIIADPEEQKQRDNLMQAQQSLSQLKQLKKCFHILSFDTF